MIREVTSSDALAIAGIYNYYVLNTVVTFEEEAVTVSQMQNRILDHPSKFPWLVYEKDRKVIAYAYGTEWKSRCSYKYSLESSIYIKRGYEKQGIGFELYSELLRRIEDGGFHAVIGGITLPNDASIHLHEKLGFQKIGQFIEVGFKFDRWLDVGYWERIFEN